MTSHPLCQSIALTLSLSSNSIALIIGAEMLFQQAAFTGNHHHYTLRDEEDRRRTEVVYIFPK